MKKIIVFTLVLTIMTLFFTGCIGKFECDVCGKDIFGIKNDKKVEDKKLTYCSDCKAEAEKFTSFHCETCDKDVVSIKYDGQFMGEPFSCCDECYEGLSHIADMLK